MSKTLDQLTEQEIEDFLAKKKEEKRKANQKAKATYEKQKDKVVMSLMDKAVKVFNLLDELKKACHEQMDEQAIKLQDYGGLPKKSKGGYSLTTSDQGYRVTRTRDTQPEWDERAEAGVILIKEFLHDTVKKVDKKLFEILLSFIEKNHRGDLEYAKVFTLLNHRDKYGDKRWIKGLDLLQEGFSNHLKGYGYEFKTKGPDGKWQSLILNFSGIKS